ncbi:MAG: heparan-alpha-glucosaminide N-acetyltransferase domain-containing protein [Candidatus Hermodarchaeota archaeon]
MKRVQSIDMVRGFCIFLMVAGHMLDWWIIVSNRLMIFVLFSFLASVAATGFLFISGFSAALAYKSRIKKAQSSPEIDLAQARNVYIIRAILLLVIAFIYNTVVALAINDLRWIWAWNALQAISICLLLAWPLLRTNKLFRIGIGVGLLIVNELLYPYLLQYKDHQNIYGILFHILYNPDEAFTILAYFAIFIIGTALGDFFFDFNIIEDPEKRKDSIYRTYIRITLIVGLTSALFGITYRFFPLLPAFLYRRTISAMFYSLGVVIALLAILIYLEEFEKLRTKKRYKFFFYFSYYSFTVYIAHDFLYFLFYRQLNGLLIWVPVIGVITLMTVILKFLHKKVGLKASLKAQLGVLSIIIINKIEQRKSRS